MKPKPTDAAKKKGTRTVNKDKANQTFEQSCSQLIKKLVQHSITTKSECLLICLAGNVEVKGENNEKKNVPLRDGMVVVKTSADALSLFEKHHKSGNYDLFEGSQTLKEKIIDNNTSKPFNVFQFLDDNRCVKPTDANITGVPMEEDVNLDFSDGEEEE